MNDVHHRNIYHLPLPPSFPLSPSLPSHLLPSPPSLTLTVIELMSTPSTDSVDSKKIYKPGFITNKILKIISQHMPQIQIWKLEKCMNITDDGIPENGKLLHVDLL
jgi:hypothetical protein